MKRYITMTLATIIVAGLIWPLLYFGRTVWFTVRFVNSLLFRAVFWLLSKNPEFDEMRQVIDAIDLAAGKVKL